MNIVVIIISTLSTLTLEIQVASQEGQGAHIKNDVESVEILAHAVKRLTTHFTHFVLCQF